jgi:hypothetical protein
MLIAVMIVEGFFLVEDLSGYGVLFFLDLLGGVSQGALVVTGAWSAECRC